MRQGIHVLKAAADDQLGHAVGVEGTDDTVAECHAVKCCLLMRLRILIVS